jgi:hypothetical protein
MCLVQFKKTLCHSGLTCRLVTQNHGDAWFQSWGILLRYPSSLVSMENRVLLRILLLKYRVIQKEVYTFKNLFYKYYWTYGDVLYIDWRENSRSYFHILQALDVSPTCDAADVKSIIQLFSHSSQHVKVAAATASVMHRFRSSKSELWEIFFPSVHRTWL